jgi:hypothetical protein
MSENSPAQLVKPYETILGVLLSKELVAIPTVKLVSENTPDDLWTVVAEHSTSMDVVCLMYTCKVMYCALGKSLIASLQKDEIDSVDLLKHHFTGPCFTHRSSLLQQFMTAISTPQQGLMYTDCDLFVKPIHLFYWLGEFYDQGYTTLTPALRISHTAPERIYPAIEQDEYGQIDDSVYLLPLTEQYFQHEWADGSGVLVLIASLPRPLNFGECRDLHIRTRMGNPNIRLAPCYHILVLGKVNVKPRS